MKIENLVEFGSFFTVKLNNYNIAVYKTLQTWLAIIQKKCIAVHHPIPAGCLI